jgi:hypothetical protein
MSLLLLGDDPDAAVPAGNRVVAPPQDLVATAGEPYAGWILHPEAVLRCSVDFAGVLVDGEVLVGAEIDVDRPAGRGWEDVTSAVPVAGLAAGDTAATWRIGPVEDEGDYRLLLVVTTGDGQQLAEEVALQVRSALPTPRMEPWVDNRESSEIYALDFSGALDAGETADGFTLRVERVGRAVVAWTEEVTGGGAELVDGSVVFTRAAATGGDPPPGAYRVTASVATSYGRVLVAAVPMRLRG